MDKETTELKEQLKTALQLLRETCKQAPDYAWASRRDNFLMTVAKSLIPRD
jgi:hypothetical protein